MSKPITLSIIPNPSQGTPPLSPQANISNIPVPKVLPNFNHVPIMPIAPILTPPINNEFQEKERIRLEQQRQRAARYNEKVKAYKKIALIDSNQEKIKALLLLCYPELAQMGAYELDVRVIQIIQSLGKPLTM